MNPVIIAPSILTADKGHIVSEIQKAEQGGAQYLHLDVMDGRFVPNVSLSLEFVKGVCPVHHLFNDVHIMVSDPAVEAPLYAKAGADNVTFHLEACRDGREVGSVIASLKSLHCLAGLSVKPATPIESVFPYLDKLHLVLIMSVEPGKGGQKFMEEALSKIKTLRAYIDSHFADGSKPLIEVDGGINEETGRLCRLSGADALVVGSYLYGHDDFEERLKRLLAL